MDHLYDNPLFEPAPPTMQDLLRGAAEICPPDATPAAFRGEASAAWRAVHGRRPRPFTIFLREQLPAVRRNHPTLSHNDHMKIIGQMWHSRLAPPLAPAPP